MGIIVSGINNYIDNEIKLKYFNFVSILNNLKIHNNLKD